MEHDMRALCTCVAAIAFVAAALAGVQEPPRNITVIQSTAAKGTVDADQLRECLRLLRQQFGVMDREPPIVVVLHVSRAEAAAAGVRENVVRWESINGSPRRYFQVWLIDECNTTHYVVAMESIVVQAFSLTTSDQERHAVRWRVLSTLNATVSARQR